MNSFFILIGSICCAADAKAMLKATDEKESTSQFPKVEQSLTHFLAKVIRISETI
jgi:hypothetical protein